MNIEEIRLHALSLPGAEESFPFGNNTLVFKVDNKVFLLLPIDAESLRFNVKCDPDQALELREQYSAIQPGFHMNKKHWNTVFVDGSISSGELKKFIHDSFLLVKKKNKTPARK